MLIGALLELLVFATPSILYLRSRRRRGHASGDVRAEVGWRLGNARFYLWAIVVVAVCLPLTYGALRLVPLETVTTSANVSVGKATTPGGYVAIGVLAVAEEIFFRGLIAGLLTRRYGFVVGNLLQALIFLAPHLLLLLVSASLWPIIPVQLVAGWLLGVLRDRSGSVGPPSVAHVATNLLAPLILAL